jgi:hypothetical protein
MIASLGAKTEVLIEALPYISRYEGKTFVVKYGGAAMVDNELKETFAQDVTLLKRIGINVAIVHGGGKGITGIASKLGLESRFVNGQRYTDAPMMGVVQMVLAGKTNKDIVGKINRHDGDAVDAIVEQPLGEQGPCASSAPDRPRRSAASPARRPARACPGPAAGAGRSARRPPSSGCPARNKRGFWACRRRRRGRTSGPGW